MAHLKISNTNIFAVWLKEETDYLKALRMEPIEETLQMEYWERLGALERAEKTLVDVPVFISTANALATAGTSEKITRESEAVAELERQLGIIKRWTSDCAEWMEAGRLVAKHSYQRALDKLEGLIVARIFEMADIDKPGKGYAL
ncbi:hypothetical protein CONPUDRAFT_148403 [Coniophora puteana RWD-64-598 SS2]|uniref:Uncharacterized protein n=1 Tax=Coniophora puteana (strain RWD-64-598) TaxID=741705 RepID=A0A5M3N626_CONPW|nr:uncharacterized protein CONPUDRAFT_148403 [Coniophora puteana RWD-64-598 SS2]EIW86311.1 hypothetical protein CONPUDRAFT_148403 [Coniophora puteana RWD-64-598 SS2]